MKCKHCIVGLLKRIGDSYKVDKRQNEFISDLMKLNVPKLLHVPEDDDHDVEMAFTKMIHIFIRENELQEVIINQLLSIVVSCTRVCTFCLFYEMLRTITNLYACCSRLIIAICRKNFHLLVH